MAHEPSGGARRSARAQAISHRCVGGRRARAISREMVARLTENARRALRSYGLPRERPYTLIIWPAAVRFWQDWWATRLI